MADDAHGPFSLSHVLRSEFEAIRGGDGEQQRPPALDALARAFPENAAFPQDVPGELDERSRRAAVYQIAHALNPGLSALCLSGGGIRSASFCLGVIQGLAEKGLLTKFDYLSTVSGGGYIGAWLSAWLERAPDPAKVVEQLKPARADSDVEPAAIEHLREYSNYLTARVGLFSGDTWAAVAIVLRNILVDWLILVPAIALVVIAFKLVAASAHYVARAGATDVLAKLFLSFAFVTLFYKLLQLYSTAMPTKAQRWFLWFLLLPAIAAGFCATCLAIGQQTPGDAPAAAVFRVQPGQMPSWSWMLIIFVLSAIFAFIAGAIWPRQLAPEGDRERWCRKRICWLLWAVPSWAAAALVFASAIWLGVYLANLLEPVLLLGKSLCVNKEVLLVILGVPWVLLSAMLAHTTYLLFASGSPWGDVEREWLGRASGWYFIAASGWVVLSGVVLLGPKLYFNAAILAGIAGKWIAAITAASGTVSALLGMIGLTPAQGAARDWKGIVANVGLAIAATIFAVALLILFSAWSDGVLLYYFRETGDVPANACFSIGAATEIPRSCYALGGWGRIAGILAAIAFVAGLLVNVNRFSLHAVYRNRLIRAFLGGSRAATRTPDPFTGFDWDDNLRVKDLWPGRMAEGAPWRPFHVINMALNLAATQNLAWQQRKAMSFAVTPLFCGSASLGYRKTEEYGDRNDGISLGTAMAISGAAASPNMGYHSSPGAAFLMTLFDVRLGWWLGNPGPAGAWTYRWAGPWFALEPIFRELFGWTDESSPYVYLSDGGHFEDLGLYEMVQRRCKWIVVVDADADPKRGFVDLGDAVRKIWIDLGARVSFAGSALLQAGADAKPADVPYFALGTIEYVSDGNPPPKGHILYIKPTVRGDEEAADVIAYKRADPAFPNQTTVDQWFDEPRLESYRTLGWLIVKRIIAAATPTYKAPPTDLAELFQRLR